jgi:hypothetical protein
MAGAGSGGGAALSCPSTPNGAFAGAASVAGSVSRLAAGRDLAPVCGLASVRGLVSICGVASIRGSSSVLGLASGMIAAANDPRAGAPDTDGVGVSPWATGRSIHACCDGSATGVIAGSSAGTGTGASTTRRSGTSIRRSCQGKPKPGSQSPWPPKVRLNSNVWISSESSSAYVSRLRSGLMRWLSLCP